jgi:hypothetical protein
MVCRFGGSVVLRAVLALGADCSSFEGRFVERFGGCERDTKTTIACLLAVRQR